MAKVRAKAAGYHGVQNLKFAKKTDATYAAPVAMLYAKNINPTAMLEATEQYADSRLLFRIPNDTGYEGEIGTTGPDLEFEKSAGYSIEGANGLIGANVTAYQRGAIYYEFTENDANGVASTVKVWLFNAEIGKGSPTHVSDAKSVEFGEYKYPFTVYGDTLMDSTGAKAYTDAKGVGRMAFMYTARHDDNAYATFGDTVPVPKVAAAGV